MGGNIKHQSWHKKAPAFLQGLFISECGTSWNWTSDTRIFSPKLVYLQNPMGSFFVQLAFPFLVSKNIPTKIPRKNSARPDFFASSIGKKYAQRPRVIKPILSITVAYLSRYPISLAYTDNILFLNFKWLLLTSLKINVFSYLNLWMG